MSDHDDRDDVKDSSSTRGGADRRGGFGDDQGTRVGRPDDSGKKASDSAGPSSQPVKEGLEGAIEEEDADAGESQMGAEAARGIHAAGSGEPDGGSGNRAGEAGAQRPGSEPLQHTEQVHESGYGGRGGEPRKPSDQREPDTVAHTRRATGGAEDSETLH